MEWRPTVVFLAQLPRRGGRSRSGYVDQNGQVAVPPLRGDKLKAWKEKMGLSEP